MNTIAMVGMTFGDLTVMAAAGESSDGSRLWSCRCSCGKTVICRGPLLRRGHTKSCGHLRAVIARAKAWRHGKTRTPAYRSWAAMRYRCENPSSGSWPRYGGRGIAVCERWREFDNFYADMGDPQPGETLDRIDNNGHYEPGNVRWASKQAQSRNTRRNTYLTFNGQTRLLLEWAALLAIDPRTLRQRLRIGWTVEQALTTPLGGGVRRGDQRIRSRQ